MRIETPRLIIREWNPHAAADVAGAFAMYSDPEVLRFFPNTPPLQTHDEARHRIGRFIERNKVFPPGMAIAAVEERAGGEVVGTALIKPLPTADVNVLTGDIEVGWHLRQASWGKGYATEFGRALVDYGFNQLNVPELLAVVIKENIASIRVAERIGMKAVGPTEKYYGMKLELFRITHPS